MDNEDAGFYSINVAATFSNSTYSETLSDIFRLEVRPNEDVVVIVVPDPEPEPEPKEEPKKQIVIPAEEVIYLSEWTGQIVEKSTESFSPERPIPYVKGLNETGVLTIEWDREIREISDLEQIPPSRVMIRDTAETDENTGRRLEQFWLGDYYGSIIDGYEKVEVKRAIEIIMQRQDEDDKILDWYVLESNAENFKVQIQFDQEDLISTTPQVAYLKVTFWGVDFFQSAKNGEPVRLGTTLEWPILNQITDKQADQMSEYGETIKIAIVGLLAAMIPFCSLGTLLPTWIFLNTAQLVSHLPLISTQLPPILQSSLLKALSFCKLDQLMNYAGYDIEQDHFEASKNGLTFDQILIICGYT